MRVRTSCWASGEGLAGENGKGDKELRNREKEGRSSWSSRWLGVGGKPGRLGHRGVSEAMLT